MEFPSFAAKDGDWNSLLLRREKKTACDTDRLRERLLSLNDPLLHPLIEACDEEARERALAAILVEHAATTIRRAFGSSIESGISSADAEDVTSAVTLRLVRRLKACAESEEFAIERLHDYIAMQTFNAVHDLLRARFPERVRLKNRIRYVLTHDARLALWSVGAVPVAGLAKQKETDPGTGGHAITRGSATRAMFDREHPADAVHAILSRAGHPLRLHDLLDVVADLWQIADRPPAGAATIAVADPRPGVHDELETREALRMAWAEIRELRAAQRKALLLGLRDASGSSGTALLLLANIATFSDIAAALELTPERLSEIWPQLPLDDLTIAGMLGLTRQQVINLRQAARDRLARRMSRPRRK